MAHGIAKYVFIFYAVLWNICSVCPVKTQVYRHFFQNADVHFTLLGLEPLTPIGLSRSSKPCGTGHRLSAIFPATSVWV